MPFGQIGSAWKKEGWSVFDTIWFGGNDSKSRMKQLANATGAKAALAIDDYDTGTHGFTCYLDWPTALKSLKALKPAKFRHVYEVISIGKPCKPYLDIDCKHPPEGLDDPQLVIAKLEPLIIELFREEYDRTLASDNFVWSFSGNQDKLSLHLVINTHNPQILFESNIHHASHLAAKIRERYPVFEEFIDQSVYTTDREMRMLNSTKKDKPKSVLKSLKPCDPIDNVITHIEPYHEMIQVPVDISVVKTRKSSRIPHVRHDVDHASSDGMVTDMLKLITKTHPSAFHENHGSEDAYDIMKGVKFNYGDRTEPCWSGEYHKGNQNFYCWIDESDDAWVKCFSDKCKHGSHHLGNISVEIPEWKQRAVCVDLKFLNRVPSTSLLQSNRDNGEILFNRQVDRWIAGGVKHLGLRSYLGSGKSTCIRSISREPYFKNMTKLVISYRQSLAYNLAENLGFYNYLDGGDIWDRKKHPEIVCQLDSIHKLSDNDRIAPRFDMIVLDEVELLLNHFFATTLANPTFTMKKLETMIRGCKRVLSLDGLWGAETYDWSKSMGLSTLLVYNKHHGTQRTFEFTSDFAAWKDDLINSLANGQHVFFASMSTEMAYEIAELAKKIPGMEEHDIIVHTSKASDDLKRELRFVDDFWNVRLVVISPTVEAGVDKSSPHFDRMFVCCCALSTTAHGLYQMTGRVRHLKDNHIKCLARPGIRLQPGGAPRVSYDERLAYFKYVDSKIVEHSEIEVVPTSTGEQLVVPKITPFLTTWVHNDVRRLNSNARFYTEFKEIAESQGHKVMCSSMTARPSMQRNGALKHTSVKADRLVTCRDLDEAQYEEIFNRLCRNEASEDDKYEEYKHRYKKNWGIDIVPAKFVETYGVDVKCNAINLNMMMLFDGILFRDDEMPNMKEATLQMRFLNEILQALGWHSVFDVDNPVPADVAHAMLSKTEMYRNYDKNIKVFNARAEPHKELTSKAIIDSLKMIFATFGIDVISISKQKRVDGQRIRSYEYVIQKKKALETAHLINLRMRFKKCSEGSQAESFLRSAGYGPHAALILDDHQKRPHGFRDDEGSAEAVA